MLIFRFFRWLTSIDEFFDHAAILSLQSANLGLNFANLRLHLLESRERFKLSLSKLAGELSGFINLFLLRSQLHFMSVKVLSHVINELSKRLRQA